jgi:hypothetical protein
LAQRTFEDISPAHAIEIQPPQNYFKPPSHGRR